MEKKCWKYCFSAGASCWAKKLDLFVYIFRIFGFYMTSDLLHTMTFSLDTKTEFAPANTVKTSIKPNIYRPIWEFLENGKCRFSWQTVWYHLGLADFLRDLHTKWYLERVTRGHGRRALFRRYKTSGFECCNFGALFVGQQSIITVHESLT